MIVKKFHVKESAQRIYACRGLVMYQCLPSLVGLVSLVSSILLILPFVLSFDNFGGKIIEFHGLHVVYGCHIYCMSYLGGTGDILLMYRDLLRRYGNEVVFVGVGFSLGGFNLLHFVAEDKDYESKFACIYSFCQGYCPAQLVL